MTGISDCLTTCPILTSNVVNVGMESKLIIPEGRVASWMTRCRLSRVALVICVLTFIYLTLRASMTTETIVKEESRDREILIEAGKHQRQWAGTTKRQPPKRTPRPTHYITVQVAGRLGNVMFLYASMLGISLINGLTPAFPQDHYLRYIFDISAVPYKWKGSISWKKFHEEKAYVYEERAEHLPKHFDVVELNGYYQSWKYFKNFLDEVRDEFTFKDHVKISASDFLDTAVNDIFGVNQLPAEHVLVGIHVRLSDMASQHSFERGYTIANQSYIHKAMNYFQSKHEPDKILFVVCSDDIAWCERSINPGTSHIVFSRELIDAMDMALLSMCNHTIITVGSFGWWSAWLAGGTTIYYKDFPRPNSTLWYEFNASDYFYPTWIGMSN